MITRYIYIASRYSLKEQMLKHAATLVAYGMEVTSRWLKEDFSPSVHMSEIPDKTNEQIAKDDLEDIIAADVMLFFCEDQDKQPPRGGRHVEFGYALAQGLRIICIGKEENIFHHLPQITHYDNFEQYVEKELDI